MKGAKPARRPPGGFSAAQLGLLSTDLDGAAIRRRQLPDGAQIAYLEGWFVVAEANAIFGYAGWEREIVHFERSFEQRRTEDVSCGYVVRVKIIVDAGGKSIVREGTGFGQARAKTAAEAHELAIKSAETDATKRALATFGNRFGLGLYGGGGAGASEGVDNGATIEADHRRTLTLRAPDGTVLDDAVSAEAFCTGLRQLIGKCERRADVEALASLNADAIGKIAELGLKSPRGTLYADILKRLLKKREESFVAIQEGDGSADGDLDGRPGIATTEAAPPSQANSQAVEPAQASHRIDKSALPIGVERRARDKEHLRSVAQMPCVICSRQPSHAHHVKFAQRHGMSQKVSDEFVVPVCALHHGDLHRASREEGWWEAQKVDPLPIAAELWAHHLAQQS